MILHLKVNHINYIICKRGYNLVAFFVTFSIIASPLTYSYWELQFIIIGEFIITVLATASSLFVAHKIKILLVWEMKAYSFYLQAPRTGQKMLDDDTWYVEWKLHHGFWVWSPQKLETWLSLESRLEQGRAWDLLCLCKM